MCLLCAYLVCLYMPVFLHTRVHGFYGLPIHMCVYPCPVSLYVHVNTFVCVVFLGTLSSLVWVSFGNSRKHSFSKTC